MDKITPKSQKKQASSASADNVKSLHSDNVIFSYEAGKKAPEFEKHNRIVGFLKLFMPSVAVIAIALMLLWPELISQKERFALGISRPLLVGKTDNLSIVNSRYFSTDSKNQPFKLTARLAIEERPASRIINLTDPKADILLNNGMWLMLEADKGTLYQKDNKVILTDNVSAFSDMGHEIHTAKMMIDLTAHAVSSKDKTNAAFPNGTIKSEGLQTFNKGDIIRFTGKAKMVFTLPDKEKQESVSEGTDK